MKKLLLSLAILVLSFSFGINAAAVEADIDFTAEATKASFEKGDAPMINAKVHNNSDYELENVIVTMKIVDSDEFFTQWKGDESFDSILPGETVTIPFRAGEDKTVAKIAAVITAISATVATLFFVLIRGYTRIATTFVTAIFVLSSSFTSFADFAKPWHRETLGTCSVVYDGKENTFEFSIMYQLASCKRYKSEKHFDVDGSFSYETKLGLNVTEPSGVLIAESLDGSEYFGDYVFLNAADHKAGYIRHDRSGYKLLNLKTVNMSAEREYKVRVEYADGNVKFKLFNTLDDDPFPLFDEDTTYSPKCVGVRLSKNATCSEQKLGEYVGVKSEHTYVNPIKDAMPDPYVLKHKGMYYLYGTNGFTAFSSTDLINWQNCGKVAEKSDILGTSNFWAPEVYYRNDRFYMLYTANNHLYYAVSDSPTGPFVSEDYSDIFPEMKCIDGHLFFDDDGRAYMYFSRIQDPYIQEIWGCEVDAETLLPMKETLAMLTVPSEDGSEGKVNEGPFMLKHNGKYFLTYSAIGFTSQDYCVSMAIADSPLGNFEKYQYNPILSKSSILLGVGHHCFTESPDGSEMLILYHCHVSDKVVDPRPVCIDRAKFTKDLDGNDIISVYGPNSTAQPYPAG